MAGDLWDYELWSYEEVCEFWFKLGDTSTELRLIANRALEEGLLTSSDHSVIREAKATLAAAQTVSLDQAWWVKSLNSVRQHLELIEFAAEQL